MRGRKTKVCPKNYVMKNGICSPIKRNKKTLKPKYNKYNAISSNPTGGGNQTRETYPACCDGHPGHMHISCHGGVFTSVTESCSGGAIPPNNYTPSGACYQDYDVSCICPSSCGFEDCFCDHISYHETPTWSMGMLVHFYGQCSGDCGNWGALCGGDLPDNCQYQAPPPAQGGELPPPPPPDDSIVGGHEVDSSNKGGFARGGSMMKRTREEPEGGECNDCIDACHQDYAFCDGCHPYIPGGSCNCTQVCVHGCDTSWPQYEYCCTSALIVLTYVKVRVVKWIFWTT